MGQRRAKQIGNAKRESPCNAALDGHKPVKMQSDKYLFEKGKKKMKFKTTAKAIRESYGKKIAVSYCAMQYLLSNHAPIAYTCGVYGWNFDVYQIDGVTICTGYRGMVGKSPNYDVLREYETKAEKARYNRNLPYEEREKEVEKLLKEFLAVAAA